MNPSSDSDHASIRIRPYQEADAADMLAVFLAAVTETASGDYTAEQIEAWANSAGRDLKTWHIAMLARGSLVATIEGHLAGFSDVSQDGHVDMMFVAPRFLRQGVARQLLKHVEQRARYLGVHELTAEVSITARPFFERQGFTVLAKQYPVKAGVKMTNFKMRKLLQ